MVVILSQTVVALYLHFRHKDRFLVTELVDRDREPAMGSFPDGLQEAILRLSGAATFEQLEEAVRESLELILPNVSDVVLYLQPINNQLSQELFCSQGLLHALPKEGLPWEAAQRRERLIVPEVDASDPLSGLLKSAVTTSPRSASSSSSSSRRDRRGLLCCGFGWRSSNKQCVVCTPAVDRENERVIAVLVAACTQPSPEHLNCLSLLERQLLVCHKRLKQSSQILTSPTPLQSTPNNVAHKDKNHHAPILTLCAELYDHDAASLQIKVIKHLAEQTQAESGFILLVDSGHREFFCQVIGNIVLKEEIRFPIEYTSFAGVLKTKSTLKLEDIEQEKKQELERKVGCSVNSLLCVPVCSQGTGDVVAIACMINKKNAERFTESDVEAIVYCFKYTATVLHSTLAVQNERRLKHQTEALLQVTKNLFTHLGKCITELVTYPDLFTECCLMAKDSEPHTEIIDNLAQISRASFTRGSRLSVSSCGCQGLSFAFKSLNLIPSASRVGEDEEEEDEEVLRTASFEQNKRYQKRRTSDAPTEPTTRHSTPSIEVPNSDDELSASSSKGRQVRRSSSAEPLSNLPGPNLESVGSEILNTAFIHVSSENVVLETKASRTPLNDGAESRPDGTASEQCGGCELDPSDPAQGLPDLTGLDDLFGSESDVYKVGPAIQVQLPLPVPKCALLDDLTTLLREIMQEARNLTKAERCSVFLLERETNELVAKVFDGDIKGGSQKPQTEVRIPANQGIAGHVNTTGQLLNIDDAYSHPLFYRRVDELTGFKTRNVLCFPIKDENDKIVGVAQLCNKINGGGFSKYDEEIAQAFSVYCCISIVNTLLYKKVQDAQHRSRVSNELMIYHMQVPSEEVTPVAEVPILPPASINPEMHLFRFTPRTIGYDDTLLAVHAMMDDMGFITKYRIQRNSLAKFVLMTRKGYRDPPYHNWHHAFAVAHFCYLLYKNVNLLNYLDEIEIFSLFVASLCHDIDHRGTNNSYQVASGSVLAALYSSEGSVLERHHLAQTMCILNTEGCNIFENLSRTDYQRALDLVRDIILATDLAHHLRILKDLKKMADEGYSKSNPAHRTLLLCLAMTSCDLSDQTKHWRNSKKIAEAIYNEFFSQGDLEKALGRKPMLMMDREKAYIPDLQIDFLNCIALPVFRLLTQVFPAASEVLDAVESNKRNWLRMNEKRQQLQNVGGNSMDIFDIQLEDENKT